MHTEAAVDILNVSRLVSNMQPEGGDECENVNIRWQRHNIVEIAHNFMLFIMFCTTILTVNILVM